MRPQPLPFRHMRTFYSFVSWTFAAILIAATACGVALAQPASRNPALAQADQLMKANRAADAYALLAPLEDQLAGDPDYDYLLGISALDSGKPDKATLAFERLLATKPDFAGARLDMGRAYLMMGDRSRARTEFETVLSQNPPEAAKAVIIMKADGGHRTRRPSLAASASTTRCSTSTA